MNRSQRWIAVLVGILVVSFVAVAAKLIRSAREARCASLLDNIRTALKEDASSLANSKQLLKSAQTCSEAESGDIALRSALNEKIEREEECLRVLNHVREVMKGRPELAKEDLSKAEQRCTRKHAEEIAQLWEASRQVADQQTTRARGEASNNPFDGKTAAQLKAAARQECRMGQCSPEVLEQIFLAAHAEDSERVRCVVRFEEDEWMCRTGRNSALCNPPPCQ